MTTLLDANSTERSTLSNGLRVARPRPPVPLYRGGAQPTEMGIAVRSANSHKPRWWPRQRDHRYPLTGPTTDLPTAWPSPRHPTR